ncbi:MAG: DUF4058 family protein [Chloroflexi bacterium]|nr:DUF4058 family protein [Chloroflexota bacterium]
MPSPFPGMDPYLERSQPGFAPAEAEWIAARLELYRKV